MGLQEATQDRGPQFHTSEHGNVEVTLMTAWSSFGVHCSAAETIKHSQDGRLVKLEGDATAYPVVGLSALRDPLRGEIRVFLDALDPVAWTIKYCHFHREDLTIVPEDLGREVSDSLVQCSRRFVIVIFCLEPSRL